MTTLLEASRMALEALECYPVTVNHWKIKLLPAATALRTAISEAEKQTQCAACSGSGEVFGKDGPTICPACDGNGVGTPQPAPKQEPVATATRSSKHGGIEWSGSEALADALGRFGSDRLVHLYLAPVQAQEPITPQALIEAANSLPGLVSGTSNWASAMVAKLNAAVVKDSLTTQEPSPLEVKLVDTLLGQMEAQPAKPLTNSEIDEAIQQHVDPVATYRNLHEFARAIEAKVKEQS